MKHFLIITSVITALLCSGCSANSQHSDDYTTKIDSLIRTGNVRPFNGVVLITQNGKIKYSQAYGYASFNTKTPLKPDDAFEIMSNSKQVTAVLLLREFDKGKVDLQAPVRRYLPHLSQSWADTVTVHQLLNHTHGIVDLEKPLVFRPGTDFMYGNISYILLGQIIESVSNKSYTDNANELFRQLRMTHTHCYSKDNISKLVSGHLNKNNTFKVLDSAQISTYSMPANGIVSTASDLALWDQNLHKGQLLKPATYKLMITYNALGQHDVFGKDKIGYGYGIRISDKTAPVYYAHTGMGGGFASLNMYFPGSDVCLVVLENQMNDNLDINYYFETEIKKILMKSKLTH